MNRVQVDIAKIAFTRSVADRIAESARFAKEVIRAMSRYRAKDWGDTCDADKQVNDEALKSGERIIAWYNTSEGRIMIVTEYGHLQTTVLFTYEY